ncbi:hypothetical protein ACJMK2_043790, partial [Sinanodonta woodiana]
MERLYVTDNVTTFTHGKELRCGLNVKSAYVRGHGRTDDVAGAKVKVGVKCRTGKATGIKVT